MDVNSPFLSKLEHTLLLLHIPPSKTPPFPFIYKGEKVNYYQPNFD